MGLGKRDARLQCRYAANMVPDTVRCFDPRPGPSPSSARIQLGNGDVHILFSRSTIDVRLAGYHAQQEDPHQDRAAIMSFWRWISKLSLAMRLQIFRPQLSKSDCITASGRERKRHALLCVPKAALRLLVGQNRVWVKTSLGQESVRHQGLASHLSADGGNAAGEEDRCQDGQDPAAAEARGSGQLRNLQVAHTDGLMQVAIDGLLFKQGCNERVDTAASTVTAPRTV